MTPCHQLPIQVNLGYVEVYMLGVLRAAATVSLDSDWQACPHSASEA